MTRTQHDNQFCGLHMHARTRRLPLVCWHNVQMFSFVQHASAAIVSCVPADKLIVPASRELWFVRRDESVWITVSHAIQLFIQLFIHATFVARRCSFVAFSGVSGLDQTLLNEHTGGHVQIGILHHIGYLLYLISVTLQQIFTASLFYSAFNCWRMNYSPTVL